MKTMFTAALLGLSALTTTSVSAQTISNTPTGGSVAAFGVPDTRTYGQVFTASGTGLLTSFTLSLNGAVGKLFGGVGTWNGPATFATGAGSPTNLFQSALVSSTGAQSFTFAPNVAVTAGSRYVAYISTFGVAGASGTTSMPLGTNVDPNINYFVYNNSDDPRGDSAWNYGFDFGDAQFTATFSPLAAAVPEPGTWAMMIVGFGVAGAAMRRRKSKVTTRVAFA